MLVRTALAWVAAACMLVAGFAWLAGWLSSRISPEVESRPVTDGSQRLTGKVMAQEEGTFLPVPGRLWAKNRARVTSEIVGRVTEVAVTAGDDVEAGEVLVKLDHAELAARVAQIEEQLPAEEQGVTEARSNFERDQALVKNDAVSREEVETSRRRLAEARAALASTRQQLVEARARLDEATIRATLGGTVVDQLVKVGEVARPGHVLLEVYQPETLRLECAVPESLVERLQIGQGLHADFGSDRTVENVTIEEIVPQADSASRTVLVKSRLDHKRRYLEGQYGRLFVPLGRREKLSVPAAALRTVGQLDFVDVVTNERKIERRFVTRGPAVRPDRIEVLSGLDAGERVVLPPRDDSSRINSAKNSADQ